MKLVKQVCCISPIPSVYSVGFSQPQLCCVLLTPNPTNHQASLAGCFVRLRVDKCKDSSSYLPVCSVCVPHDCGTWCQGWCGCQQWRVCFQLSSNKRQNGLVIKDPYKHLPFIKDLFRPTSAPVSVFKHPRLSTLHGDDTITEY